MTLLSIHSVKIHNLRIVVYQFMLFILCLALVHDGNAQKNRLFDSNEVLEFTLRGDLKSLFKDRSDDPQYHKVTLHYQEGDKTFNIPLKSKTRGNFRKNRGGCKIPPLFLNFKKSATPKSSIFRGQDKMKLVTHCRSDDFVIHEYLVYKVYNIISPNSFNARLLKVVYEDTVKEKSSGPYYGFLLEEEEQMAKRLHKTIFEKQGLHPKNTRKKDFLTMAVFQYLIGNTDWSIQYQQNIKYMIDSIYNTPITVPYDFDHAGIVRAPYAHPAPELKLSSTLERNYRGYCMNNMSEFDPYFEKFNNLKDEIYNVYKDNELLNDGYKKQTLKFLDDFYETINNPKKAELAFMYPCDPNGTGNIIIKGLNAD